LAQKQETRKREEIRRKVKDLAVIAMVWFIMSWLAKEGASL
jgi:hypothetical protein